MSEHRRTAVTAARCAVVTVSDTRTEDTDASGRVIAEMLAAAGHTIESKAIVRDEPADVRALVEAHLGRLDAVITTGGTGLTSRDSTYEAIAGLLEKRIDGFGELFRALSYAEIGSAAMLSRATAGTARGTVIFMLPGSEAAARLGMAKLVIPEIGHIVRELRR